MTTKLSKEDANEIVAIDAEAESGAVNDVRDAEEFLDRWECCVCEELAGPLVVANGGVLEGEPLCESCSGVECFKCGGAGTVVICKLGDGAYHERDEERKCKYCDGDGYLLAVGRLS